MPKQFWLLSRHGTRNPGTKDMKKLQEKLPLIFKNIKYNFKEGRGSLCDDDISELGDWRFIANVTEDKYLVDEGVRELKGLGYRFHKRFPSLLTKPFVNESYVVNLPKIIYCLINNVNITFLYSSSLQIQRELMKVQRHTPVECLGKKKL